MAGGSHHLSPNPLRSQMKTYRILPLTNTGIKESEFPKERAPGYNIIKYQSSKRNDRTPKYPRWRSNKLHAKDLQSSRSKSSRIGLSASTRIRTAASARTSSAAPSAALEDASAGGRAAAACGAPTPTATASSTMQRSRISSPLPREISVLGSSTFNLWVSLSRTDNNGWLWEYKFEYDLVCFSI